MIPDNGSVYLDNHATTRVDPDVVQSMVPWFTDNYGNAGSGTHAMGTQAREAVEVARQRVAQVVGATSREIVFTSGATESINLAMVGAVNRQSIKQCVVPETEHAAVLDVADGGLGALHGALRVGKRGVHVVGLLTRERFVTPGEPIAKFS